MQYLLFPVDAPQLRDSSRSDIRNGDAAEAFAIAKLLKWGFDAHDARRDFAYDIGVDLGHGLYCRVQVKSRAKATGARWGFRCVRGNPRTGVGSYADGKNDYDVTACVALSMERVIFVPGVHPSIQLTNADFARSDGERQSWARALLAFERRASQA